MSSDDDDDDDDEMFNYDSDDKRQEVTSQSPDSGFSANNTVFISCCDLHTGTGQDEATFESFEAETG